MRILQVAVLGPSGKFSQPTWIKKGPALAAAGFAVQSITVSLAVTPVFQIIKQVNAFCPRAVIVYSVGSAMEHPYLVELTQAIRRTFPKTWIIYLTGMPVYRWDEILSKYPQINYIMGGGDFENLLRLFKALEAGRYYPQGPGIAYWYCGRPVLY